jgi:alanine dehydrogenase
MKIGVPKECKIEEHRVGLTPASVKEFIRCGHQVMVQHQAGTGIGFPDADYQAAGATVLPTMEAVYEMADLIVKVKEPQPIEYPLLRDDLTLFTYLHLAPDAEQTDALLDSGVTAIAYETVTSDNGSLPLLMPMSQVAGRLSIQAGAHALEKPQGGSGILLGGVPGVRPAKVVVVGGGVVGTNAARMAMGVESDVVVLDRSIERLRQLDLQFGAELHTIYATQDAIEKEVLDADLVVGAVLIPGASAPRIVSRGMLKDMQPGSVLVDVSIDQGGCFETSRATTHTEPTYIVDGVVHYCVSNMPGAVPRTSTFALNNATLPFALNLANKGIKQALKDDPHLLAGLNTIGGKLTCEAVAVAQGKKYTPAHKCL